MRLYDRLVRVAAAERTRRVFAVTLIVAFFLGLLLTDLARRGWLPESLAWVPPSHFAAINFVFTLLLIGEIVALIFVLPTSFANAVGKQFEVLGLIFLRQAFKEFSKFDEPIQDIRLEESLLILTYGGGALVLFVLTGIFFRLQQHKAITMDPSAKAKFIAGKKVIAMLLLFFVVAIGIYDGARYFVGLEVFPFFETVYTLLIFGDVLIVLLSLVYTGRATLIFRNFGFALTTLIVRLALAAVPFADVLLGTAAILLAIGITVAYNRFDRVLEETAERPHQMVDREREMLAAAPRPREEPPEPVR